MKIMVASDIHGSAYYCGQLLDALELEKPEKLLLLGDILYHGPRNDLPDGYNPKEVIEQLNAVCGRILCVRGNCDSEVDQMVLKFPILSDYCILYAAGRMIFATHGHHFNEANPPLLQNGDILLNGHTHVPKCTDHGNYLYVNPGSVSIPKENSDRGYIILSEEQIVWKTLCGKEYNSYRL